MNPHTQWRLALADRIATKLQHFDAIEATAAIGSVARGYADAYSDLELLVIWDQPPDAALRHAVMIQLDAELREPARVPVQDYALRIDGAPVDLWHTTQAAEDALIDTVLHEHSLDLVANNRLDLMASCIPLHGPQLLERFKQRAAVYPDALAQRSLEAYLPQLYLRHLNVAALRDNPTSFLTLLTGIQNSLFLVLLALNRVYFPTFKWMYRSLDRLTLAPAKLEHRLRHMLVAPPPRAATELRMVLDETLDLVEAQYPRLDTTQIRYGLDQPPHAYEQPDNAGLQP